MAAAFRHAGGDVGRHRYAESQEKHAATGKHVSRVFLLPILSIFVRLSIGRCLRDLGSDWCRAETASLRVGGDELLAVGALKDSDLRHNRDLRRLLRAGLIERNASMRSRELSQEVR